jgi:hypothetical protein
MIIADRLLKLRDGQTDAALGVRVFLPERDQRAWSTRYEIDWPEGTRKGAAIGIDSVQSLLFALKMIGAEIYTSDYHKSGKLKWSETGQGYGFPVPQNLRDILQGDDAKFL